jgi:hypothetical protein
MMSADGRSVVRDGAEWQLGDRSDIAWIDAGTTTDCTIQSSMPLVFDAYATVVIADDKVERERQDRVIVEILSESARGQPWWLGYLDTGGSDVVFPEAPRVFMYAEWGYVLVEAGPDQAASWRDSGWGHRRLPDLIFPSDRSWLVSTLWDDDWTCVGGPAPFVDRFIRHPILQSYTRAVSPGEDATPPGHDSI